MSHCQTARHALSCAVLFALLLAGSEARAQEFGGYYPADTLRVSDLPEAPVEPLVSPAPAVRPRLRAQGEAEAVFQIQFASNMPAAARAAYQYAADIWSTHLASPIPIVVDALWEPLGEDVLGSAGPFLITGFPNQPAQFARTWYPFALANAMAGEDIGGEQADIESSFSSEFTNWYFGTDGQPPPSDYDFVTVVLHELGHGLGFVGSFGIEDSGLPGDECPFPAATGEGCWGQPSSSGSNYPFIFDRFTEDSADNPLLSLAIYPNPSVKLADTLRSGRVYFDGVTTTGANQDLPVDLFAPNTFELGSSYSHLDESVFPRGGPNSLMTPRIGRGEVIHSPGAVTCGLMQDIGWELGADCLRVLGQEPITEEFQVSVVGPNPFTTTTTISIGALERQIARVEVYNVLGQRVAIPFDGILQPGLAQRIDLAGAEWPSGVYFVHVVGDTFTATASVVHVR